MARLLVTFLLFLSIASFVHARDLVDRSKDEISDANSAQNSDSEASIFLASEKIPDSEPQAMARMKSKNTETNPLEISESDASETSETDDHRTIQIIFRPINRQFQRRPLPLIFRRGRHRCRHHNQQNRQIKPWERKSARDGEISYGDDMILAGDRSRFDPDIHRKSDREDRKWNRVDRPWDSYGSKTKKYNEKIQHHHIHRRHKNDEEVEEEHDHKESGGFMESFRKFLNLFEF